MTQEQKAEAYNKAIEEARKIYNQTEFDYEKGMMEQIFPELKSESEDEKIRKELIAHIRNTRCVTEEGAESVAKWIAWLERQGNYSELVKEMKKRKELLSKEKEKAVSNNDKLSLGGRIAMLGELLVFANEKQREQEEPQVYETKDGEIITYSDGQSMDMAYTDANFNLVEQNLEWSEEDENRFSNLISLVKCSGENEATKKGFIGFINRLKCIIPQKSAAWSEEDERLCQCLIKDQEKSLDEVRNDKYGHSEIISDLKEMYHERIDWLKSLKGRYTWKPNDKQIEALDSATENCAYSEYQDCLRELLDQLKKLK